MQRIHIFRAGSHAPMQGATLDFSVADLAATARAYDPARHEAPLVVGHPVVDAPAYGWVAGLVAEPEGLFATPRAVDPAFAEIVRAERYRNVSASFWRPDAPRNPVPGTFYLKHVGFLGAVPPAVAGLQPVQFGAEDDTTVTVEFALPTPETRTTRVNAEDDAARQRAEDLAAREAAIAAREASFAERAAVAQRAEDEAFVAGLVAQARLPQALAPRAVAFMAALPAEGEVAFADAGAVVRQTPREALRGLLSGLPAAVSFGDVGGQPGPGAGAGEAVGAVEFAGHRVDADRMVLHRRALAYQRQHPDTDYLAAVLAVEQVG
jgi:hypothetical protein